MHPYLSRGWKSYAEANPGAVWGNRRACQGSLTEAVIGWCSLSREGRCKISAGGRDFEVTTEMLEIREELQKESGK